MSVLHNTSIESDTFFLHFRIKHGKGSPLSPISATPPTPSTVSTGLHPSPPGFYPTPPYCSASASHLSRGTPTVQLNSTHAASFKFDAGSSRSNSENQDSDLETNSPRYTYTLPRSGEGTPQSNYSSNGYDQVDLPLDNLEPVRLNSLLIHAHHRSHDPIRFSEAAHTQSRVSSAGTARSHKLARAYPDRDSPQLMAQVQHGYLGTSVRMDICNMECREHVHAQQYNTCR